MPLHPLHPVRVPADHHVGPGVGQRARRPRAGRGTGLVVVYCVPQCGSTSTTSTRARSVAHDLGHPIEVGRPQRSGARLHPQPQRARAVRPGGRRSRRSRRRPRTRTARPSRSTTAGRQRRAQVGAGADGAMPPAVDPPHRLRRSASGP